MTLVKHNKAFLLAVRAESSYGAGASMTGSTDFVEIFAKDAADLPVFQIEFADDGDRGISTYSNGRMPNAAPAGKTAKGKVQVLGKGFSTGSLLSSGAPYLHEFLEGGGLSGSFEVGGITYKPISVDKDPTSFALEVFNTQEKLPVSGCLCTIAYGSEESEKPVLFEFEVQGLAGVGTDFSGSSIPARIFPASGTIAPSAKNLAFTVGSYSGLKVRKWRVEIAGEMQPRLDQNAVDGHSGFYLTPGDITLTATVENPDRTAYNVEADWVSGSVRNVTWTVGAVAGNKIITTLPQAQLINAQKGNDGNISTYDLTFRATATAPDSNDHFTLRFV